MCAVARCIYADTPGSQPPEAPELPLWSLYDEPKLYDRVFGERDFSEEVSDLFSRGFLGALSWYTVEHFGTCPFPVRGCPGIIGTVIPFRQSCTAGDVLDWSVCQALNRRQGWPKTRELP